jgi:hypothetical protein
LWTNPQSKCADLLGRCSFQHRIAAASNSHFRSVRSLKSRSIGQARPGPTNSLAFIRSDVLQASERAQKSENPKDDFPVDGQPNGVAGSPGSGLAVILSVALRDFFANRLKVTA